MLSIFKDINLQKRRIRTLKRINLLTFPLLTYLVGTNLDYLSHTRAKLVKKTRITKEVFGAIEGKDRIAAITPLQQVSILFS